LRRDRDASDQHDDGDGDEVIERGDGQAERPAGEERADDDVDLRGEIERRESLRAARAWGHLADILETELTRDRECDSDDELHKRMIRVRNEFAAPQNGAKAPA
jgi:hypothetical protein